MISGSDQLPHSNTASRLQALFHSLCRVLCTVRSHYFCTIGSSGDIEAEQVSNCQKVHAVLSNSTTPGSGAHTGGSPASPSSSGTGLSPCVTSTKFQAKSVVGRKTCVTTKILSGAPPIFDQHATTIFESAESSAGNTCRWFQGGHVLRPRRSHRPRPSLLFSFPLHTDMLKFCRWFRLPQASLCTPQTNLWERLKFSRRDQTLLGGFPE